MSFLSNYEFEISVLVKMLAASVMGGLIGLEREIKGRPAGLKTFSLVCIGSTLIMITNEYLNVKLSLGGDTARMAAQIVSGIGFLGAGTIMVTGQNRVKGLTTAAALWTTAALGIAIGIGFWAGAILGIVVIYGTSFAYRYLDRKILESSKVLHVYVEGMDKDCLVRLLDYFSKNKIKILGLRRTPENAWDISNTSAVIEMELPQRRQHSELLDEIRQMDNILYIEEI